MERKEMTAKKLKTKPLSWKQVLALPVGAVVKLDGYCEQWCGMNPCVVIIGHDRGDPLIQFFKERSGGMPMGMPHVQGVKFYRVA
jgi:hypothetical protein